MIDLVFFLEGLAGVSSDEALMANFLILKEEMGLLMKWGAEK